MIIIDEYWRHTCGVTFLWFAPTTPNLWYMHTLYREFLVRRIVVKIMYVSLCGNHACIDKEQESIQISSILQLIDEINSDP